MKFKLQICLAVIEFLPQGLLFSTFQVLVSISDSHHLEIFPGVINISERFSLKKFYRHVKSLGKKKDPPYISFRNLSYVISIVGKRPSPNPLKLPNCLPRYNRLPNHTYGSTTKIPEQHHYLLVPHEARTFNKSINETSFKKILI